MFSGKSDFHGVDNIPKHAPWIWNVVQLNMKPSLLFERIATTACQVETLVTISLLLLDCSGSMTHDSVKKENS